MRSSPVAPVRALAGSKKKGADEEPSSASISSSTLKAGLSESKVSSKSVARDVSPRRVKTTQPQFLTRTMQFVNPLFPSSPNHYAFSTFDSVSPTLTSPSLSFSNDKDTTSVDENRKKNTDTDEYQPPMVDSEKIDDVSNASTDDPYTYSDDSASLSDAYFLQQPSSDSHLSNTKRGQVGLISILSEDGEQLHSSFEDTPVWSGPPWINVGKTSVQNSSDDSDPRIISNPSSRRYLERDQRRQQRQRHQERNTSSLSPPTGREEGPINENSSLLDDTRTVKSRRYKEQKKRNTFARTKSSNRSIAKSNTHRQHRKKHQLRKHEQNLLLHEQQKRQEERERAVFEIRGRVQPLSTSKHMFWLVLFTLQLILVCTVAIKDGLTFYRPPPISDEDISSLPSSFMNLSGTDEIDASVIPSIPENYVDDEDPFAPPENMKSTISKQAFFNDTVQLMNEMEPAKEEPFTFDYKNILSLLVISGMYACVASYLSFAFMLILARSIIPIMLVFSILLMLCWGVLGLTVDNSAGPFISLGGFVVFGMSAAYTLSNWNQVPFCSTNFHTAICAMRSSIGILLVGVSSLFVGLLWLLTWTVALMGTFNRNNSVDCEVLDQCETHVYIFRGRMIEVGLLLVSLYWTTMVIKNIVRVVVAGAVGGPWWFGIVQNGAEDTLERGQKPKFDRYRGCCYSSIVFDPLIRACTSSLGTICFGSLVDLPVQLLSPIVTCICVLTGSIDGDWNMGPASEDDHEVAKLSQKRRSKDEKAVYGDYTQKMRWHLRRLDRVLQFCNRWSYTYIGMYNYSYDEGGEKAIRLFETREWMDIARDTLIQNILLMTSIVIGGWTGLVAVLVEEVDGYTFSSLHKPILTSFLIGFFLGLILSYILLLGVAGSAANTVLVCFAAEPFEFDRNHPNLSREMREVWSQQVWEPDGISS